MVTLRISLFGRFRCMADRHPIGGIEARKVQELLVYLLLHRAHPCTRESLATLLWGERNDAQARKYLRQALWQLQGALDAACHPTSPLLRTDAEWVEFDPAESLWLDVDQFEDAYALATRTGDATLSQAEVDALCEAAALYQGDLLEGWYQEWCTFERERLQQMYLTILDRLIAYAEQSHDCVMGIHYCELALRTDPARERTHRRLMRLHYLAGNRTDALRQYETCIEMLQRELGVGPARSTLQLREQIRHDELGTPGAVALASTQPATVLAELNGVLEQLNRIQTTMMHSLEQVQHDIDRIESLIRQDARVPS